MRLRQKYVKNVDIEAFGIIGDANKEELDLPDSSALVDVVSRGGESQTESSNGSDEVRVLGHCTRLPQNTLFRPAI